MEKRKEEAGVKKRILIAGVTCTLLLLLVIGSTLAYLSDHGEEKVNAFTVGEVTIDVEETFAPPSSLQVGDNIYEKRVSFANHGTVNSYARVLLACSETDVANLTKVSTDGGTTWVPFSELKNKLPAGWAYQDTGTLGGYYYYKEALKPGETTTPLITHVKTTFESKTADTNESINRTPRDYEIYVYVDGLQQQKLDGSKLHTDYQTAWTEFLKLK